MKMVFSFHKTIFLVALILVHDGCFSDNTVSATALEKVCRETFDQHFCLTNFGWRSSTKTADFPALANLAIGNVIENMNMTKIIIDFLLYFTVDPRLQDVEAECKKFYGPPFSSIVESAYYYLNNGYNQRLVELGTEASNAADLCQKAYASYDSKKAPFKTYIYNLKRLCNILVVLADKFLWPSEP